MKFQKTINGVVVQVQPNRDDDNGFIECPDYVHCGMLFDGTNYTQPPTVLPVYKKRRKGELSGVIGALIDAQTSPDPRYQMRLMRKAIRMLDKQANGGKPRDPVLDQLAAISDYADLIEDEETNGHDAIDAATDEAAVDTAYDAALAAAQAVPLPGV